MKMINEMVMKLAVAFCCFLLVTMMTVPVWSQGWLPQVSGTNNNLLGVAFPDSNHGWAVSQFGAILHTTNGGNLWNRQCSGTTNALNSIAATDSNNSWIAGNRGLILNTSNGGNTWNVQTSGTNYGLFGIVFTSRNRGWAVGDNGTIIYTANGGDTWSIQNSSPGFFYDGIAFSDSNNGCAVGGYYVNGEYPVVAQSTNGGASWWTQVVRNFDVLFGVTFYGNNGWAVGNSGAILCTNNGGANWVAQSTCSSDWLNDIVFPDQNHGWAVGGGVGPCDGIIIQTTNGGVTWVNPIVLYVGLYDVSFPNANNGWAVGDNGTILHYNRFTSVPEPNNTPLPSSSELHQNYPNPFNSTTTITYDLPHHNNISISLFDVTGREVKTLVTGKVPAGVHRTQVDGSMLATGPYFVRLKVGDDMHVRKVILLK